ncbi:MAG: valine--tRNA ligase [bacterium]
MDLDNLSKAYQPGEIETKWYQSWIDQGLFRMKSDPSAPHFSIVIPPPNITGSLHMGHALNNTLQDILIRWKRMQGYNTLWQYGIDHAGIATQNVVEKQLAEEGIDKHDLGQEKFVKRVWEWKKKSGGLITEQLKKLGASCDWTRERFTMDEGLCQAVREVFVNLYKEGLIYRDNYIINWCPRCFTALSDLEVEYETIKGNLYYIKYPVVGKKEALMIATTRPETMLGDTALTVHPEDNRYKHYIGQRVILPLMDREIPVLGDQYVDPEFGTGVLKVTPSHDPNDFELGMRHGLPLVKVINEKGLMTDQAGVYVNLDRFTCRKRLIKDLQDNDFLDRIEEYEHAVGHCYRCHTIIEPLVSKQWFVKMESLVKPAIEAIENKSITIIPAHWETTYFEWMNNIRDWCISRQIWWGHRIPAWLCAACERYTVAKKDPLECEHCHSKNITQESDVLDTWFSSALWPFSTLGWPEQTEELAMFYPTSILVTGFDILFFWVARMITMGYKCTNSPPFRTVYLHALVRDEHGQKMSKSKGNVIDPLVMMEKYGTDAFRFTLTALTAQGRDICLSEERIEGYRHFVNKIWNAARFVMINLKDYNNNPEYKSLKNLSLADRWILHRVNSLINQVTEALESYQFNEAANLFYQFWWHEFCDWYIEIIKIYLSPEGGHKRRHVSQYVMREVMSISLRLLHPIMPFITEHIWQLLPHEGPVGSILVDKWPVYNKQLKDKESETKMSLIMDVVRAARNIRGEMNVPPSSKPDMIVKTSNVDHKAVLEDYRLYIITLARLNDLMVDPEGERPSSAATAIVQGMEIIIPLQDIINFSEEATRLSKELSKLKQDLLWYSKKLSNEDFITKAPKEVVVKDRERALELEKKKDKLEKILQKVNECIKESAKSDKDNK